MTRGVVPFAHGHALAAAASPAAVASRPALTPLWRSTLRLALALGGLGAGLTAAAAGLLLLTGGDSLAQTLPASPTPTSKAPCVMVDIAGHKAGNLDCANQTLADTAARAQAAAQPHADIPTIGASPTALGEANEAATRERLGSSFGTSVVPQRPAQTYAPPLGRPPR